MISIRNATVIKSGKKLLDDFSLTILKNEHCLLSGRNGAGKTLLLELIAGLVHPSHGTVDYDFITHTSWEDRYWERRRKIHLIPTHAIQNLFTNSSDLYYQQRYYKSDNSTSKKVKDVLAIENDTILNELRIPETLNIHSLLNVNVDRLSNGQLKKVLLLKSLMKEKPMLLLLDYPFEGLDKTSRTDLSNFIDFIATTYSIQVILTDHHHHLPTVINRTLMLDNFRITSTKQHVHESTTKPIANFTEHESDDTVIVEMKNLRIQYDDVVVLKDFNWQVRKGERWALVGRNGAGKTTVFSLIFADHPMAYSQKVYLFGKKRGTGESIWDIKRRITYLGPELLNYLNAKSISHTAREYILNATSIIDTSKFAELIDFFNAHSFIDHPVKILSSGQLQIMLVITAFLEDKELLLLDEPFQFLDGHQKNLMMQYMQLHLKKDTTLILITHYDIDILNWTKLVKQII